MANIPAKLQETLDDFSFITTRDERVEYLIQLADEFEPVPETIATKPYDEAYRVPACESDAFVWAIDRTDGTLDYYFDVLNPQGLSAMAICGILADACSGTTLEEVASIETEIVFELFGKDISMGKGNGLMGIVNMVVYEAKKRLN